MKENEYLVEEIGKIVNKVSDQYYDEFMDNKSQCSTSEFRLGNYKTEPTKYCNELKNRNIKTKSLQETKYYINTTISNCVFDLVADNKPLDKLQNVKKMIGLRVLYGVFLDLSTIFLSVKRVIQNIDNEFGSDKHESDFDQNINKLKHMIIKKNEKITFNEKYIFYIDSHYPDLPTPKKYKKKNKIVKKNRKLKDELLFIAHLIEKEEADKEIFKSMMKKIDKAIFHESIVEQINNILDEFTLSGFIGRRVEGAKKIILKKIAEECMEEYLRRYQIEVKEIQS